MQLNLTTVYAIRCLACLAESPESMSSRAICQNISLDREFTLKVLRRLRHAGLVEATRGKAGGFILAKPADEISLWKVIEVTEDSTQISKSLDPERTRLLDPRYVSRESLLFHHLQGHIEKLFGGLTLQNVLDDEYIALGA